MKFKTTCTSVRLTDVGPFTLLEVDLSCPQFGRSATVEVKLSRPTDEQRGCFSVGKTYELDLPALAGP
jgi:hypothetical protein